MNDYLNLIENAKLINTLLHDNIKSYLSSGKFKIVSYKKNNVIHFDGEECKSLDIILSGKVIVERIDQSGNLLTISEFCHDDILGGNLLFSSNPYYPMTITAQLPSVLLEIEKELLFELFCGDPIFLRTYLEFVSDHAYILGDKIKHYVSRSLRESIMSYFKNECKKQNSNHIKLTITKKALAEKIGVQRTSLSRELKKMKNDGLIEFDHNSITIL